MKSSWYWIDELAVRTGRKGHLYPVGRSGVETFRHSRRDSTLWSGADSAAVSRPPTPMRLTNETLTNRVGVS